MLGKNNKNQRQNKTERVVVTDSVSERASYSWRTRRFGTWRCSRTRRIWRKRVTESSNSSERPADRYPPLWKSTTSTTSFPSPNSAPPSPPRSATTSTSPIPKYFVFLSFFYFCLERFLNLMRSKAVFGDFYFTYSFAAVLVLEDSRFDSIQSSFEMHSGKLWLLSFSRCN